MLRQELEQLLEKGESIENVLGIYCGRDASGRCEYITVRLCKPAPPNLYPPLALSEMPNYVAFQQKIAQKPYSVTFPKTGGSAGLDLEETYFATLHEVAEFLAESLGHSLEEVSLLPDFWGPD